MTLERSKVSILMAAYNVASYLADAAYSVLQQTHRNLELFIVNDGSTDRTGEVAEDIRRSDPARVQVLTIANGGPGAARNAGMAASSGDFFAVLDSDDVWEPVFLERQLAVYAAHPEADLVTANGRFLGGRLHGAPVRPWPDARPPITLATIIADEQAVYIMTVFRRRVFDTLGGFSVDALGTEDFDYWLRAAIAGFRFERNDEPLSWYRRRDDSLSANAPRMLRNALKVCRRARPALSGRPEQQLLDRQIAYYEVELDAALLRQALAAGDTRAAVEALAALHARRPTFQTAVATLLARRAAPLLTALYQLKLRVRQA